MTGASTVRAARRIVIAGGGLDAWMAAAALARAVARSAYSVTVVADSIGGPPAPYDPADATLPPAGNLHEALRVDEDELIRACDGAFTYGTALSGWSNRESTWFHSFGPAGANLGPVPFHHLLLRLRHEGMSLRLANYSLAALAAQAGRFARPGNDLRSVLSTCRYGLHLDTAKLTGFYRAAATAEGVIADDGPVEEVKLANDGRIAAIVSPDGTIEGDLFLDATGVEAKLAGRCMNVPWEDWSGWLPCTHYASGWTEPQAAPLPYSIAAADASGWTRHLPLQRRTLLARFYASDQENGDEAPERLLNPVDGSEVEAVQRGSIRCGRRARSWHRNCVAIGAAAAVIDPVAVTNLHLLRSAMDRLLRLLPGERSGRVEAAEYNRLTSLELDHARDFALLHYKLNGRHGEPLWDRCRAMPIPESADYKLRSYASRGRVTLFDEEPLDEASWLNLFDEHGVQVRRYSRMADGFDKSELQAHLERVRHIMIEELKMMPQHGAFLARLESGATSGR